MLRFSQSLTRPKRITDRLLQVSAMDSIGWMLVFSLLVVSLQLCLVVALSDRD
jgi:hypothetical protein